MITERQEKLLNFLIKEYISTAEPVGSLSLKEICDLDISGATIRNDLQELTKQGFIEQPHTSAGRVPTQKAYKYFTERIQQKTTEKEISDFIVRQINHAHQQMYQEIQIMEKLMQTLEKDNLFEILITIETWHKKTTN